MRAVKVGVIGVGEIGGFHAGNIRSRLPGAQLIAIADLNRERLRRLAGELEVPGVYDSGEELLADSRVEAVLICTTPESHTSLIASAAQAGKHIFCEKPIGIETREIVRALAAVRTAGVLLQIGFNRRFDPSFARMHRLVSEGAIGRPESVHIISRDPEPPGREYYRLSGGIFLDMTIHDFDMARFLTGDEVESVFAAGSVLIAPWLGEEGDVDTAAITLHFRNGALGLISNSCRAAFGYDQRVEVFGSTGMLSAGNRLSDVVTYVDRSGHHRPPLPHFFIDRYTDSYQEELRQFFEVIVAGGGVAATGDDGFAAVRIAEAAKRSLESGRAEEVDEA